MRRLIGAFFACTLPLVPVLTLANTYPERAITIVVPFGPDSATDVLARALSKQLSRDLGVAVIVENKGGAAGTIGAQYAAASKPDGYTLILGSNGPFAANVSLYKNLPYSPSDDFEPIVLAGYVPQLLLTSTNEKSISTLDDVVEKSKRSSGTVSYGATNTTSQIWAELLKKDRGFDAPVVLFKDTGAMFIDLATQRITFAFGSVAPARSMITAGKIKPIAITGDHRMPELPNVPTLMESGFSRYSLDVWMGLFAPRGTPTSIIERINKAVNAALNTTEIAQVSHHIGMTKAGGSPQHLRSVVRNDIQRWKDLVALTGVAVN